MMQETEPTTVFSNDFSQLQKIELGSSCNKPNLKFPLNLSLIIEINQISYQLLEFSNYQLSDANKEFDKIFN